METGGTPILRAWTIAGTQYTKHLKPFLLSALLLLLALPSSAQQAELELDVDGALDAVQQWANENLDEEVLKALPTVDRQKVEKFLREFQTQLQGEYVLDLPALKDAANAILPLLDAYEETSPYAAWLRARLDYFDVAEEFRKTTPVPKLVPGEKPKPLPNPSPEAERKSWEKKLSTRDWPKGAKELVPTLKPIFARQGVPTELVWLAEVESGFNTEACSPVGAAGLYQLMPATAKRFGVGKSWFRDQRYQPEPNARAAAQYLKILHDQFGDWRLALAAYNSGEGTVKRLLTKHNAKTFDGIATRLPAETQMFVPKVEATIFKREGKRLGEIPKPLTQTPKKPS